MTPKQYIDKSGNTQWKFTNNTPFAIRVRALRGGGRESINPGQTKDISRGESYQFLVKSDNGHRQLFEGQNHSISIIEEGGDLVAVEENSTKLQGV
ncbi:hypothetical protein Noda2021_10320 [Candidatus Dependentiae bacterium Noda2021]|nr:hypothetical protein Noda2021_10320 [Candidatus Dependentiae bacterium Noda2021]